MMRDTVLFKNNLGRAYYMTTSKHFYSYHSHIKEIFCWADMPYVQYIYMYMHVGGSTEKSRMYHAYIVYYVSWIPFLVGNLRVS